MIDKSPKPIYEYNGVNYNGEYVAHYEGYITSLKNGKEIRMRMFKNKKGYNRLTLTVNGKGYGHQCHRIVATYFCENDDPINKTQVDHISGSKEKDDCADNLEWVTPHENLLRARKLGLKRMIVTEELCHEICDMIWNKGMTDTEIGNKLGIVNTTIFNISSGKYHRYISEKYANGNWSPNSDTIRISEEQIHKICDMVWNKGMTSKEIAKELNLSSGIVYSISSGRSHRHISDKYSNGNWSPNSNRLSEEQIHEICELRWIRHYSGKAIVDETGFTNDQVEKLIYGKTNKDISLPYIKKAYENLCAVNKRFMKDMRAMYRGLEGSDREKIKETQRVFPEIDNQVIKYAICTISDEVN